MPSSVLEVMQNYKIYDASRQVLLALAAYSDQYGPRVFPSLETLARDSGLSKRHVQRCIARLETQHYLQVLRRKAPGKNARNYYVLLYPWRTTAQKSRDTIPDLPAQKSRDIQMSPEDLKKTKEREKRSGSVDIPRNIPPEVLNQPNGPDEVQRFLTPGSFAYAAALSDTTPDPVHQADRLAAFQELDADVWHPIVEPGPGRGVGWRYYVGISSTGDYVVIMPLDQQKGREGLLG